MKIASSPLTWALIYVCQVAALSAQPRSGHPLPGISSSELSLFNKGREVFEEVDRVENGLGPRFNLDGCAGCHSHPSLGGSSPAINPQIEVATKEGALNRVPEFLTSDGP